MKYRLYVLGPTQLNSKLLPLLAGGLRGVWEGHPCPDTPGESGNYNLECVSPMYVDQKK